MKPIATLLLFFSLIIFSCKPEEVPEPPSGLEDAAAIEVWSGNNQSGTVRETLAEPLVVRVLDENGEGVVDVPVNFLIVSGNGSLSDSLVVTNAEGLASSNWTMGDSTSQTMTLQVVAQIDIPNNGVVPFYATANAFGLAGTMTDNRDGKIYATTQIGNQVWMAENLRYNVSGSFQNPQNPGIVYGYLYTWSQAQTACPTGWHLPNNEEWQAMAYYLSGQFEPLDGAANWDFLGQDLKSTSGWTSTNGNNLYNFNAYPAGIRTASGASAHLGDRAYFWSANDTSATDAYYYRMNYYSSSLDRDFQGDKDDMYSCRCIRD
jgi:uncharacterized protein (TIGR02145 family)